MLDFFKNFNAKNEDINPEFPMSDNTLENIKNLNPLNTAPVQTSIDNSTMLPSVEDVRYQDIQNQLKDYSPNLKYEDIKNYFDNSSQPTPTTISTTPPQEAVLSRPIKDISQPTAIMDSADSDLNKLLSEARQARGQTNLTADMLRAGSAIGNAIAGTNIKAGEDFAKTLQSRADQPISDVVTKQKVMGDAMEQSMKKLNIKQRETLMDPNSDISKMTRSLYEKSIGQKLPDNISANDIQQAGFDSLVTASMRAAELKQSKLDRADTKQSAMQNAFKVTAVNKLTGAKQYRDYQNIVQKANQIEDAINNPSGFKDVAAIYAYMKSLDPESVVRESEFKTAAGVGSLQTKVRNILDKSVSGKTLQPEQRKELMGIAKSLKDVAAKGYKNFAQPYLNQAKKLEIQEEDILPADFASPIESIPNEVERQTSDGKIAIFDSSTKKFLRYK